jgi:hypothetical protein
VSGVRSSEAMELQCFVSSIAITPTKTTYLAGELATRRPPDLSSKAGGGSAVSFEGLKTLKSNRSFQSGKQVGSTYPDAVGSGGFRDLCTEPGPGMTVASRFVAAFLAT